MYTRQLEKAGTLCEEEIQIHTLLEMKIIKCSIYSSGTFPHYLQKQIINVDQLLSPLSANFEGNSLQRLRLLKALYPPGK